MADFINQFKVLLNKLSTQKPTVDPTSFEDELALNIEWTPKKSGGSNFTTHILQKKTEQRIRFIPSTAYKAFISVFIVVGTLVIIIGSITILFGQTDQISLPKLIPMLVGSMFILVSLMIWRTSNKPKVFDKDANYFWIGKLGPHQTNDPSKLKVFHKLENIYAIQLISEYVSSNKSSYYSFELNLVLNNGERINIIDHGNLSQLRNDAQTLATFLDIPVWDAI